MIELAGPAVEIVTDLLGKLSEKAFEVLGKKLFAGLKSKVTHAGTNEALDDLAQNPADVKLQNALEVQLGKALKDPQFGAALQSWMDEVKKSGLSGSTKGHSQVATATNGAKVAQVIGKSNQVKIG
jgi:hypothetical protein